MCHPVDIFQEETTVFRPDFQTGIFFYDSRFNPAVILSKASQHSQRHQPDEFLSCDARELTETLLNRLTCLKSHCAAHVLEKLVTLCQEESLPEVGLRTILVKKNR